MHSLALWMLPVAAATVAVVAADIMLVLMCPLLTALCGTKRWLEPQNFLKAGEFCFKSA